MNERSVSIHSLTVHRRGNRKLMTEKLFKSKLTNKFPLINNSVNVTLKNRALFKLQYYLTVISYSL